ncbi:hypothetical protein ACFSTC_19905 [Nonomuraea ferruginea]
MRTRAASASSTCRTSTTGCTGSSRRPGRRPRLGKHAAANYYIGLKAAVMSAISDLGLGRGRVATDNLSFAGSLDLPDAEIADGYGMMKFVRSVKTAEELTMLRQATRINQLAIERTAAELGEGPDLAGDQPLLLPPCGRAGRIRPRSLPAGRRQPPAGGARRAADAEPA